MLCFSWVLRLVTTYCTYPEPTPAPATDRLTRSFTTPQDQMTGGAFDFLRVTGACQSEIELHIVERIGHTQLLGTLRIVDQLEFGEQAFLHTEDGVR